MASKLHLNPKLNPVKVGAKLGTKSEFIVISL